MISPSWVITTVVFVAALSGCEAGCADQTSCVKCAGTSETNWLGVTEICLWCPKTNKCNRFFDFANTGKCAAEENLVYKSDCPGQCPIGPGYNETLSRHMFMLASAAYTDHPLQCLNNGVPSYKWQVVGLVTFQCGQDQAHCLGYVARSDVYKVIAVAFRGTSGALQLTEEGIRVVLVPKIESSLGGEVMEYFSSSIAGLKPCIKQLFDQELKAHPDYKLWFTGHSLGGALAALMAASTSSDLQKSQPSIDWKTRITLYTYGQPRTGNLQYAQAHNKLVPHSYRVINKRDSVPKLPTCDTEMVHATLFRCKQENDLNYHHGTEVWYKEGMAKGKQFKVCGGQPCHEDFTCSNMDLVPSVIDHMTYFDVQLGTEPICGHGIAEPYVAANVVAPPNPPTLEFAEQCKTFKYV